MNESTSRKCNYNSPLCQQCSSVMIHITEFIENNVKNCYFRCENCQQNIGLYPTNQGGKQEIKWVKNI